MVKAFNFMSNCRLCKLLIFRPNLHNYGNVAVKHLRNGCNGMQQIFYSDPAPSKWGGGHGPTTRTQKTLFWCKNWHFFGHFAAKNGVFLVAAALKHLLNGFNGMQHIFS